MGDWELGPIPNPKSPIPNPQSPNNHNNNNNNIIKNNNYKKQINNYYINLNKERNKLIEKITNEKKNLKDNNYTKIEIFESDCEIFFPICTKDLNFKYEISDYFISKKFNDKFILLNDYFTNKFNNNKIDYNNYDNNKINNNEIENKEIENSEKMIEEYLKNISFERKKHICMNDKI